MIKLFFKYLISSLTEIFGIISVKVIVTKSKTQAIDNKINMLLLIGLVLFVSNQFNIRIPYAS